MVSDLISAASLRLITGICLTMFLSQEKKNFEFVHHGNYLANLSKQLLVFSLILFIGRETMKYGSKRKQWFNLGAMGLNTFGIGIV